MKKLLIKNIIQYIAGMASIFGLLLTIEPEWAEFGPFQWLIFILACIAFLLGAYFIYEDRKDYPKIFTKKEKVRDYMYKWIENGGRTAIFTRDMSWVYDDDMRYMLSTKAKKGELIICLLEKNEEVEKLEGDGATIIEYKELELKPSSRFTITNFGKDGARVAVGKPISKNGEFKHLIKEYSQGKDSNLYLADDLINAMLGKQAIEEKNKSNERKSATV